MAITFDVQKSAVKAKGIVQRTISDLTRPQFIKQMIWVSAFWLVALVIILGNIHLLRTNFTNPVRPDDLILSLIPETPQFLILGEIIGTLGTIIVMFVMWQWRFEKLPLLLFLLAAMYILRSFVILMTPLAQIQPPSENFTEAHWIAQNFYHGMFFSGHTASAFIQAFFIKGHSLRDVALALACIQVMVILFSHSHYTIDVVGGFFVAYFFTHYDFMRLVPASLRHVWWMPWYREPEVIKQANRAIRDINTRQI